MGSTRLGLIGLLAVALILGGMALGHVVASAAGWPAGVGQLVGLAVGFSASTAALRRAYSSGQGRYQSPASGRVARSAYSSSESKARPTYRPSVEE